MNHKILVGIERTARPRPSRLAVAIPLLAVQRQNRVALVGVEFPEGFERDLHTLHVVWCTALVLCGARCRVLQGERCTLRDPFYTVARLHIGWLHVDA